MDIKKNPVQKGPKKNQKTKQKRQIRGNFSPVTHGSDRKVKQSNKKINQPCQRAYGKRKGRTNRKTWNPVKQPFNRGKQKISGDRKTRYTTTKRRMRHPLGGQFFGGNPCYTCKAVWSVRGANNGGKGGEKKIGKGGVVSLRIASPKHMEGQWGTPMVNTV